MDSKLSGKTIEILMVEDNWGDVLLMREAFQRSPQKVNLNIVSDGEEALAFLNREARYADAPEPQLILLDLNLPRLDGRAFLRRVKSNPRFQHLRVVVLTSSKLDTDMREAFDMQAEGYLVKPMDLKGFEDTIQRLWKFWLREPESP